MEENISIGKINIEKFKNDFEIITDEVIITPERIEHVIENHKEDFELFFNSLKKIIESPDYILKDMKNKNTAMCIKHIENTNVNVIVRVALENDEKHCKNSIITFYRVRNKNLRKLIQKNECIYKYE